MRLIATLIFAAAFLSADDPLAQVFDRAVASLSAGDYPAAEAGFQQVLKASPNHIGALGNLGVIFARTDRLDQAIALYRRALKLSPADHGLLLNLGLAYVKEESFAEALPVFRGLAKTAPANLQVRELLATTELRTGQTGSAVFRLETLRTEEPQNAGILYLLGIGYLKQGRREEARRALDTFLASMPPAEAGFTLCRAYYESEQFDDAAEQCRRTLQLDPQFAGAHREMGKVLISLRSPDALKELAAAAAQNPNDAEALYFWGAALVQDNRNEDAIPHLERARDLNPGFWGNYYYLGKAHAQLKQPRLAAPLLEKAADLNSGESGVFFQLGRVLTALGRTAEANRAMARVRELKALGLEKEIKK